MKYKKDAWRSIAVLMLLIGIVDIVLLSLVISIPDLGIALIPLIAISIVVGVARIRKLVGDAKIAQKAAAMRQKQANGTTSAVSSFYGKSASTSTAVPTSQTTFLTALKRAAKEYAYKAQRQKYASYANMQEVCDKLNAYALSRGIKLGEKAAEALVMAMVSSKCIFIKKTGENTEDILSIVGEFFSGEPCGCLEMEAVPTRPSGLVYYHQDNMMNCTNFFKRVYEASFTGNAVCCCALKNISGIAFASVFADFINQFKNPYGETTTTMSLITSTDIPKIADKKFMLPNNVWYFFLLNGDEELPADTSLWSETVELQGVGAKNTELKTTGTPMAYSQFNELIEGAFDENFLPLEVWKKLDKVEDYLFGAVGFKIDNILARQLERFTTMQVACGGTHVQAMDAAIAHKVLPLLSEYKKEQIDQEGTTLKELLDGLFGVENIPECHKALSILQLD